MKVWEFLDEKKQLGFRDFKLNYFFSLSRLIWEVTSREEDKDSSLQSEATEPTLMYARWMSSPSGTTDAILFVEDYNIFYIPDVGIEEKKIFPLSQTEVVKPEVIFHGIPDWIYEGIVQHTVCRMFVSCALFLQRTSCGETMPFGCPRTRPRLSTLPLTIPKCKTYNGKSMGTGGTPVSIHTLKRLICGIPRLVMQYTKLYLLFFACC